MNPIRTHNAYHLGDNLVHLNFLRRAALANPDKEFLHSAAYDYLPEMKELVSDVPNLRFCEYGYLEPSTSIDAWRGSNGFWYGNTDRYDFVKFHVEHWFPHLSRKMGIENPVDCPSKMLFDSPAIQESSTFGLENFSKGEYRFDVLLINSAPQSGQYGYDQNAINGLAWILLNAGKKVISTAPVPPLYDDVNKRMIDVSCTKTYNMSVAAIGHLSLYCSTILMIATGPCWTTFNIWNQESVKSRVILLDNERIHLSPNTVHCTNVHAAAIALQKSGMI